MLSLRAAPVSRPAAARAAVPAAPRARVVTMRSIPQQHIEEVDTRLEAEIAKAKALEAAGKAAEAKAAWDNVEELGAAASHMRDQNKAEGYQDPLEAYCGDNPDADECRVYDD